MKKLTVAVIALDYAGAQSRVAAQARAVFGARFLSARVSPKPVFRPKQPADRHVFQATLSITSGSIEEWTNSWIDFSGLDAVLGRLEQHLG
jgi:hypothetical protein